MKTLITIPTMLIFNFSNAQENLTIGKNAGKALLNEKYCIIIGEDPIAENKSGKDFIFYVDYKVVPTKRIELLLRDYEKEIIAKGFDSEDNRNNLINLINKII